MSSPTLQEYLDGRPGMPVKLHLGCGGTRWKDFTNVDLYPATEGQVDSSRDGCVADVFADVRALHLRSDSVDAIFSAHMLEHFVRWAACDMLADWHRMLKPGGELVIEMPDFWRCVAWLFHPSKKKRTLGRNQFYGNQWDRLDFETHRYVWSAGEIKKTLREIGFRQVLVTHEPETHFKGRDMRVLAIK